MLWKALAANSLQILRDVGYIIILIGQYYSILFNQKSLLLWHPDKPQNNWNCLFALPMADREIEKWFENNSFAICLKILVDKELHILPEIIFFNHLLTLTSF